MTLGNLENLSAAGRLRFFLENWKKLTHDTFILKVVQGCQIPLLSEPTQFSSPSEVQTKQEEQILVDQEIEKMLEKQAIKSVQPSKDQFLSTLFLVTKKDGGYRPVVNLKNLNWYIPYEHFKMEGLFLLKEILKKNDYMCKIDLKDAYFAVPLHSSSQKHIRLKWKGNVYQFLCLCFGLSSAPRVFTKLMKIPISVMRKLNVRLIIFLDDILIMASTKKKLIQARDTLIFPLQTLALLVNKNKSVLHPSQILQFLGVEINSKEMSVSLPQEKKDKIISQCQGILIEELVSIKELTQVLDFLSSTAIAVLAAPLQYRVIQRQQIAQLTITKNFDSMI